MHMLQCCNQPLAFDNSSRCLCVMNSTPEQVEDREPKMMDSYNRWGVEQVAGDVKEAICRVSDSAFDPGENANIPTVTYEVRQAGESSSHDAGLAQVG